MSLFRYYRGERIPLHSGKPRFYGRLIIIDESGEIGSSSQYCVLVASVTDNAKGVERVTKMFPPARRENKHYSSLDETKVKVLKGVVGCSVDIYAVSYKKSKLDLRTPKRKKEHNLGHTLELIELVLMNDEGSTYDLIVDNTTLMRNYEDEFVRRCYDLAVNYGKWFDIIEMGDSSGIKVLQIHDYIASTVGAHIEHQNDIENACHDRFRIIEPIIKQFAKR